MPECRDERLPDMGGNDAQLQAGMFSYIALEDRIPTSHPLRAVRRLVDVVWWRCRQSSMDCTQKADDGPSLRNVCWALLLQVHTLKYFTRIKAVSEMSTERMKSKVPNRSAHSFGR